MDKDRKPTTEKLATALEALEPQSEALREMIKKARQGYYDDFKSELMFPLQQLAHDVKAAGHPEFVARVIDGEFDAPLWESEAWIKSDEGQDIIGLFLEERG